MSMYSVEFYLSMFFSFFPPFCEYIDVCVTEIDLGTVMLFTWDLQTDKQNIE